MKTLAISALCVAVLAAFSPATGAATADAVQPAKAPQVAKPAKAAPAVERDPICGMSVDPAKARDAGRTSVHEGSTYLFCSDTCKKRFDADPVTFAARARSGASTSGMSGCCCGDGASSAGGEPDSGRKCCRRMR